MSLISTLYTFRESDETFQNNLVKGKFGENIIYDDYKAMGYQVNLLKTKNKDRPQRFLEDKKAVVPDIRIEKYSPKIEIEERFFIECKTRYSADRPFSISESVLSDYIYFYENFYPRMKFTTQSEFDTFASFIDVCDNYNNTGYCTIYMCQFNIFNTYKKIGGIKNKSVYLFPENKLVELESWNVPFSYDENDIYTHACPSGVMSHKRKTETLDYPFVYDFD